MDFNELISVRRSIRKYKDQEIEESKIDLLIKAALKSPSGKRQNPWEFILIKDRVTLNKLSVSKKFGSKLLANAPLAFAVVAHPTVADTWIEDCSIASIYLQLQAQDLGLGSCWVQINKRFNKNDEPSDKIVKQILNIPEELNVLSIIAIGYPDEEKTHFDEDKLQLEKIKYEKY